ncbi:MAG: glutamate--tRNA ligase [Candidatus Nealsonbacteria bacterium CG_4_10_14_0_8_um_filter_37_14]|uniref:Glutamate--tRNA ligase n=1 Tax=Candidatus Nealsonbacteria bacterium CG_4_10_14_0_8_um_filter_37_14 TaxID=1974684 RepID=A0A2M7R6Z5_9BACT|nr:MAG: glutamate--tRNA ligase [Candidatus Nealsonbacteria bacterium CG_4_10_14_0_8_um_filter_37_14]
MEKIRVRIAPSPTGKLHIGTARAALFNYLSAKKHDGIFILRIEDTDLERSNSEFEKDIIESLKWLRIEWDEGPDISGAFGPYRQSERLNIYATYLEKLLSEDKAYFCFCSEQEMEAQRQYQLSIGESPHYNGKCAALPKETVQKYLAEGKSSVIRFRLPAKKVEFSDLIRGHIEFDTSLLGDIVIAKNLTSPLYNFTCAIDDFEMKISHVIRGEDHISNTPKQILIQEALGFPRPKYAHLPLILGPDRIRLSKRHAATAISEYRKMGYLPEAMVNFMAFLGWNPGGEREIFNINSLIKEFSLEKVQKGGAIFNIKRLNYLNGFYIRQKSLDKLTELCLPYLIEAGLITPKPEPRRIGPKISFLGAPGIEFLENFIVNETKEEINFELLKKIVGLYQERLKTLSEIPELIDFFFKKDVIKYNKELLKWKPTAPRLEMTDKELKNSLDKLEKLLSKIKSEQWNKENLEKILLPEAEKIGAGLAPQQAGYGVKDRGYLLWPFRIALTRKEASAGPFEIAEILGKEKTLKRIKWAKGLL